MPFKLRSDQEPKKKPFRQVNQNLYDTAKWKRDSKQILQEQVFCQICKIKFAECVDHKIPHSKNGKFWIEDGAELQACCYRCHNKKTREENK